MECNPSKNTWELALDFHTSQTTICSKLKKIGKVNNRVHHTLHKKNKWYLISIITSFLWRQRNEPFPKKYHYRWWKMSLLWLDSTQKVVDWQTWISVAYRKSRASWKRNYAVCMVGSHQYYSFEYLNHHQTLNVDILSAAATCARKSLKKMPCTHRPEKHFPRRTGKNVQGKLGEFETSWILLKNQQMINGER